MAGKASKPTFLWQGVLILLPVLLLALGSVASLRWDEQSAERDARQKAAQSVQSLAEVLRYSLKDETQRFLTLQNVWTMELLSKSQPSVTASPDRKLAADITKWEQDYPGLRLADLATGAGELLEDGREIDPPDEPVAPLPPKWFRELSPKQRELWQTLREKVSGGEDYRKAHSDFAQSGVSDDASQAAANLERALINHGFNYGSAPAPSEYSESGISFRGIALAQMLHDPGIQLSNSVQQGFWSEIIQGPSFIAPMLLQMAEARSNGADAVTCEKLYQTRRLWEIQMKEREWLETLRQAPELKTKPKPSASWARWTTGSPGDALALGEPVTFGDMGPDQDGAPLSGRGQNISFVPREVLDAILTRALAKNRFLIPDFAQLVVTVQNRKMLTPPRHDNANAEILGTATGTFGPVSAPEAANFDLTFLLASRYQMLAAERHRATLFGVLVLGAVGAALIGFVMARRAFSTQLQLSQAKSNFVSSVSHELRAPIASVRLMAESLERGKVSEAPKQNEYFRFIVQECRRLTSLIENVLDFSRIEQGRKQYEFEPTDLAALTRETVKLMEPYAAERDVILETSNIEHRTSNIELEVDGRAIQQALVNLVDNAIKHSPKGAIVRIGFECDGPLVRLWVEDHGPGIPQEEHEKIFERFYRLGSELRRETQGVGIGLSIVRHIVEAHGGRVTVRSSVGQGSRFTIELPANNAKPQSSGGAKDL